MSILERKLVNITTKIFSRFGCSAHKPSFFRHFFSFLRPLLPTEFHPFLITHKDIVQGLGFTRICVTRLFICFQKSAYHNFMKFNIVSQHACLISIKIFLLPLCSYLAEGLQNFPQFHCPLVGSRISHNICLPLLHTHPYLNLPGYFLKNLPQGCCILACNLTTMFEIALERSQVCPSYVFCSLEPLLP